ncbi:MAG TPA: amylo-alpha-1,6-glucosidase [Candidatus Acidoferrum sp.]|nr:amylo-alpha-1,6-glucosidase [Candidatus Acidoferrum sp.]
MADPAGAAARPAGTATREWLVTNALGGYAAGTISGVVTRRYHGLLIAALPAPHGRVVMLSHLRDRVRLPDRTPAVLSGEELTRDHLVEFRLEAGLPVWRYDVEGAVIEREILMPHGQNTVNITYRAVGGSGRVRLTLRPSLNFRPHHAPVSTPLVAPYALTAVAGRYELSATPELPKLRWLLHGKGAAFTIDGRIVPHLLYRDEEARGEAARGDLWSPGYFRLDLTPGAEATLIASTEPWETILALAPDDARAAERERRRRLLDAAPAPLREGVGAQLVLAADQFIIQPVGRTEDAARARAAGDEMRSVIAGYHWFTDWGRDSMISLPGLTLVTGREVEAGYILRTFAHYVRDGLIPNLFPEGDVEGLYHTADATLWFFHAFDCYFRATGDRTTLRLLLPRLTEIVARHVEGTRFGIGVDPADGLLRQGAPGYQLTWMDAKVDDWVVTPRRGKAVEINALWYNALRLLAGWLREERGEVAARAIDAHADHARESFNRRFWYAEGAYLYDVVDGEGGDDSACRPNQLFAISLPHAILDAERWKPVLECVRERLLTPLGLRSLAPGHPDYKPTYFGDLRARDAAYHQGTVWAWLIGPWIDAWLRVHPEDRAGARRFLDGFVPHLNEACVGSLSEIFDAEPPFTPRGCAAQAWSVAEVLRCWLKTSE